MHKWYWGYDLVFGGLRVFSQFASKEKWDERGGGMRERERAIAILSVDFPQELFQHKTPTQNLELTGTPCMPPDDCDKWTHFRMGANVFVSRSCRDDNEKVHSKWWMVRSGCQRAPAPEMDSLIVPELNFYHKHHKQLSLIQQKHRLS